MHRQMIRHFADNHLRQYAGRSHALLNRLSWFSGGPDLARAGVLLARIFDHQHLCWNVFVPLAHLFANMTQRLPAIGALLIGLRQIVNDSLPLQMPRQRLPSTRLLFATTVRRGWRWIGVIVFAALAFLLRRGCGIDSEFLCKQTQLIGGNLLATGAALSRQQLAQQTLRFIQLCRDIDQHLLQDVWISRQAVFVDRH
jgi:hypothetical protein